MIQPIRFIPYLKETIWGGNAIPKIKGFTEPLPDRVGESWEISGVEGRESIVSGGEYDGLSIVQLIELLGEPLMGRHVIKRFGNRFPLLFKLIDAHDNLSLQVHPDARIARRYNKMGLGKNEMWYILESLPGAKIRVGLTSDLTPVEYDRRVADGTMIDAVQDFESHNGDVFYIPAGRLHAIGTGNLLVEIQDACDITYRIDDYGRLGDDGRPRDLHTEEARSALDYKYYSDYRLPSPSEDAVSACLVECPSFNVGIERINGRRMLTNTTGSFIVAVATRGSGNVFVAGVSTPICYGQSLLIAASTVEMEVEGDDLELLMTTVPL